MSPRFEPVARRTVAEEIREQLMSSITAGGLMPGDRVPSERELCEEAMESCPSECIGDDG